PVPEGGEGCSGVYGVDVLGVCLTGTGGGALAGGREGVEGDPLSDAVRELLSSCAGAGIGRAGVAVSGLGITGGGDVNDAGRVDLLLVEFSSDGLLEYASPDKR